MAKTIQVIVDVQSDSVKFATDQTLTLTQQVRLLYKELQKVPEGTAEWTVLQKRYNDTKDSLDRVNVKSKELFGTLSTLPGPVGDFSAKLQGGIDLLKTFSSFTLKDLKDGFKGVVGDIAAVFSNLSGGAKTIDKVTESSANAATTLSNFSASTTNVAKAMTNASIAASTFQAGVYGLTVAESENAVAATSAAVATSGFNVALRAVVATLKQFAIFTGVAVIIAALAAALFKAGEALGNWVNGGSLFVNKTKEAERAARNLTNAIAEQQRVLANDLSALDQAGKINELRAKLQGKSDKELLQLQIKSGAERLALLKANDDAIFQQQREFSKITNLSAEEKKKIGDDLNAKSLKSNQDVIKQINDNEIASLNLKLKIYEDAKKAGEKADQDEIERVKKALEDKKTQYKEDYNGYADALKQRREATDFYYAGEKFLLDKQKAEGLLKEEEYNLALFNLQKQKNETLTNDENTILEGRLAFLKEGLNKKLITQQEYDKLELEARIANESAKNQIIETGYNQEINLLDATAAKLKEVRDLNLEINKEIAQSWIDLGDTIGRSFAQIALLFEQGSDAQKTFGIISVLINAAAAVGKVILDTQEAVSSARKTIQIGTDAAAQGLAISPLNPIIGAALIGAGTAAAAKGAASLAKAQISRGLQIGTIAVTSAAQIAAITSAGKNKGGSTSVAGGGGTGGGSTPSFNGTVTVPAPVIGASQASTTGGLGQTIAGAINNNNSTSRPIQAYVVGGQITTQQQLDRRISLAAKMAG